MKCTILSIAVLVLAGCASIGSEPYTDAQGNMHLTVPAARVAECHEQGGCGIVTRAELDALAAEASRLGADRAQKQRGSI